MTRDPKRLYRGVGSQTTLEVPHEHEQECEDAQQGHAEPEIKHELRHLKPLRAERELRGGKKVGEFGKAGFVTLTDKALKNFGVGSIAYINKGDVESASDQVSELIQKKEKVDGIICLEAAGGSGAAGALHGLHTEGKLPIVAFDDDPESLDWIDAGAISVTITQKPYVMSYYGLEFLDDLQRLAHCPRPPMPTFVDTGTVVVGKSNLKFYREALAAHSKPL